MNANDRRQRASSTGHELAEERRQTGADRRDDEKRRRLEMILDRGFRPARWASRASYALGLQGGPQVHVDRREIALAQPMAKPLRIAFATDFHAGATTDARILENACAQLEVLKPDVLLLGGDFVSVRADDIHALAPLLASVHAPMGKFAVFGNHDLRGYWTLIEDALEKSGVRMLVNEVVQLPAPHVDVSIIGLDDPIVGSPNGELLDAAPGVRILLMHAPDGVLAAGERHYDLALCGHTHGGQIVLPGGVIPYLPHGQLSRQYPVGLYHLGPNQDRRLLVSRGVGCSTVPVRLGCAAEIHLITIT